jgi:hypothetical protein
MSLIDFRSRPAGGIENIFQSSPERQFISSTKDCLEGLSVVSLKSGPSYSIHVIISPHLYLIVPFPWTGLFKFFILLKKIPLRTPLVKRL